MASLTDWLRLSKSGVIDRSRNHRASTQPPAGRCGRACVLQLGLPDPPRRNASLASRVDPGPFPSWIDCLASCTGQPWSASVAVGRRAGCQRISSMAAYPKWRRQRQRLSPAYTNSLNAMRVVLAHRKRTPRRGKVHPAMLRPPLPRAVLSLCFSEK